MSSSQHHSFQLEIFIIFANSEQSEKDIYHSTYLNLATDLNSSTCKEKNRWLHFALLFPFLLFPCKMLSIKITCYHFENPTGEVKLMTSIVMRIVRNNFAYIFENCVIQIIMDDSDMYCIHSQT